MSLLNFLNIDSSNRLFPIIESISKNTEEFIVNDIDKYFGSSFKNNGLKNIVDLLQLNPEDFTVLKTILSYEKLSEYERDIEFQGKNIHDKEIAEFIGFLIKSIRKSMRKPDSVEDKIKESVKAITGRPILEKAAYEYKKNNDSVLHRDYFFSYYIYDNKKR